MEACTTGPCVGHSAFTVRGIAVTRPPPLIACMQWMSDCRSNSRMQVHELFVEAVSTAFTLEGVKHLPPLTACMQTMHISTHCRNSNKVIQQYSIHGQDICFRAFP